MKTYNIILFCRYLDWNSSEETLYIKTVQNKETPLGRQVIVHYFMHVYWNIFCSKHIHTVSEINYIGTKNKNAHKPAVIDFQEFMNLLTEIKKKKL